MPVIEWISLYGAVPRLQELWGVPPVVVEQIVRNVVQGGKVEVRAVKRGQLVPQIVTGQIELVPNLLVVWDHQDAEIDWNGLVEEGHKLIPSCQEIVQRPTKPDHRLVSAERRSPRRKQAQGDQAAGRRQGQPDSAFDRMLFPEMKSLIEAGKARSSHEAALMLARDDKVAGAGHEESKAKRLATRYLKECARTER